MMVFASVSEAIRAGFSLVYQTSSGYHARRLESDGKWTTAFVYIP